MSKNYRSNFTRFSSTLMTASLLTLSALPFVVQATNGYFPHGFGTKSKGMAGAGGAAFPQDTTTAYSNPAGMVKLGRRVDGSLALFSPDRSYTANDDFRPDPNAPFAAAPIAPGKEESDNKWFLIPAFGVNYDLDEKSSLAFTLVGHGGMNTEYPTATFQNFAPPANTALGDPNLGEPPFVPVLPDASNNLNPNGIFSASEPTGVDLVQLGIGLTYARQLTENHAVGITPLFAIQAFKAEGLEPFTQIGPDGQPQFSVAPDKLTNNGYDYSYGGGIRIGWLGDFMDRFSLGVSYQSRLYMTKFDDYKGLFAEGGDFDIPAVLNLGAAIKIMPKLTLVIDYQRIYYGDIDALNNSNDIDPLGANRLGSDDGLGFGWDDVDVYKIGLQYDYSTTWSFRAGYSHGDQPFEGSQALFNILAPATIEDHASLGLSYRFNQQSELSIAYTHAFKNKIKGQNIANTGSQTGNVEMDQNEFEIGLSYQF